MSRYGLFCFLGRGHLDPGLAIGRGLQARGHEVTVFHIAIAEAAVRDAGLRFVALDQHEPCSPASSALNGRQRRVWRPTLDAVSTHAARTLKAGPPALRAARVEVVVADQLDVAAGTVAESLGIPFVTLSCAPPLYLDDSVPPPYFGWPHARGTSARARNRRANALVERLAAPVVELVNMTRRAWNMPHVGGINQLFSSRGIITQLPAILELPRAKPPHLFYTAQFRDDSIRPRVGFDGQRLDGRPLVYASMGTIRNSSPAVFRIITEACAPLDVQLVVSLGGGLLGPAELGPLPGDPIVVHYAPQRALLERATLTVNCGGLNTTLDSLRNGIPIVAMPVAEDQPGVAARIAAAGVGMVEPVATLTVARLRHAIATALTDPRYRGAACRIQRELLRRDGVVHAVDLIEQLVGDRQSMSSCQGRGKDKHPGPSGRRAGEAGAPAPVCSY